MAVKRTTTTTKPAAKKSTTTKTAAKPAAKTAAKSTTKTAAKPAAKTAAKPAAKPATKATKTTEISVAGNKKIGTLQKDFNKAFPYLRLTIAYSYARDAVKKGESIRSIDEDKTLASVRRADSVAQSQSQVIRKSRPWRRSLTLCSAFIAKYATPRPTAVAITPPAPTTRRPSPPSTPNVRNAAAKKAYTDNNCTEKVDNPVGMHRGVF